MSTGTDHSDYSPASASTAASGDRLGNVQNSAMGITQTTGDQSLASTTVEGR